MDGMEVASKDVPEVPTLFETNVTGIFEHQGNRTCPYDKDRSCLKVCPEGCPVKLKAEK